MVGDRRTPVSGHRAGTEAANTPRSAPGIRFWKMTGSGNDFVFIDESVDDATGLDSPEMVARICSRTDGVGADGVVFLSHAAGGETRIRYYNRDGSRGELCGNASLCTTNLAVTLGIGSRDGLRFETDIGAISARMAGGQPQIDLQPAKDTLADAGIDRSPGELRLGYTNTGVPHIVVLVESVEAVDLNKRGAELRHHPTLKAGANVNFLSGVEAGVWRMRTYERGVEGETMACGTGSAACAILLREWSLGTGPQTSILTSSGRQLTVTLAGAGGVLRPSLRGEGRIVFSGVLADL